MELNDIIQLGAKAFKGKLDLNGDGKVDINEASEALKTLLSNNQGQFDLAAVVDKMRNSGLADLASSWLSDGKNDPVTPGQIKQIIDPEKLKEFASKLNIREIAALNGLSNALPNLIDKSSINGVLNDITGTLTDIGNKVLESVGGVDGALEKAKSALGLNEVNAETPPPEGIAGEENPKV